MKTKEELTAVKEKAETMNEKVRKLTDEELRCSGGIVPNYRVTFVDSDGSVTGAGKVDLIKSDI